MPPHRCVFVGRPDSAVCNRSRRSKTTRQGAALLQNNGEVLSRPYEGHKVSACPIESNARGEHLLSLVNTGLCHASSNGCCRSVSSCRSTVSAAYRASTPSGAISAPCPASPGADRISARRIEQRPVRGQLELARSGLDADQLRAGAGSGKIPSLSGRRFKVVAPGVDNQQLTLKEIARLFSDRLVDLFRRDENGLRPAFSADSPFQSDPHWKDLLLFNEYFHGETGLGLGAMHQTGWTGLVAICSSGITGRIFRCIGGSSVRERSLSRRKTWGWKRRDDGATQTMGCATIRIACGRFLKQGSC